MKKRNRAAKLLRLKVISLAVASCFSADLAFANPAGPAVVNGIATFQQSGNLLQITNSPSSIINWQSFSIGTSEITRFLQQSNSSAVLNRVITQNPSAILGALQSNGRVFLINPNGILFGAGAQIDVAGLVASSLNLSDTDFLAGRLRFTEVPGAGSVINQGAINAASGGQVYLVGPSVTNSGIITSPKGEVILAAGNSVELVSPGTPNLRVEITAPDNQALNLGQIIADSGRVGIYAGLINQSGVVQANTAVLTVDGRIVLKATNSAIFAPGSVTTATGPLEIEAGDITVAGNVISGPQTISAKGNISVVPSSAAIVGSSGDQAITAGGALTVQGGASGTGESAQILASGDQTISASSIAVTGGGGDSNFAEIRQTGATGSQSIEAGSITITGGSGGASNFARIRNDGTGAQTITGSPTITLVGGTEGAPDQGNFAQIRANGMQSIDAGSISITAGASGFSNSASIQAPHQVIDINGDLTVVGGGSVSGVAGGSGARIGGLGPTQSGGVLTAPPGPTDLTLTVSDNATLSGGSSSGAAIGSSTLGGTAPASIVMTVGGDLTLNTGLGAGARIGSSSSNLVAGDIVINAGTSGAGDIVLNGNTGIRTLGEIAVSTPDNLTLTGGTGTNRSAQILGGGNQMVTANHITLTGGVGTNNAAEIFHTGVTGSQSIEAGSITITGGAGGPDNFARIRNDGTGAQTITGSPVTTITGGTGGLLDHGNFAQIRAAGPQIISAGATTLTAGASGFNNFATIQSPNQDITVDGNLTLTGGGSISGLASGAAARIGGFGGGIPTPTNLTLTVDGNVTMNGGTEVNAGAVIGSNFTGGQRTDITMDVTGNVTLNTGTVANSSARIGSPNTNIAGGDISITTGGNITLANSPVVGTRSVIRTLDSLTLDANNITVGGSLISGAQTITAAGGITVAAPNAVNALVSATGPQHITAGGALTVQGGGAGAGLSASITGSGGQTIDASSITITGGSGGSNNFAEVLNLNGAQTITGTPAITLTGGDTGTNNFARIRNDGMGAQTITAGDTVLTAGAGGVTNFAVIQSRTQAITVHGDLTLTGGGTSPTATSDAGARIGGLGAITPTNLVLHVDGDVTLNGGSASGATIGANLFGGQRTDITMTVGRDVTLNSGAAGARIGSPAVNVAGGDIAITAGGNIALNSNSPDLRTAIRTTEAVTLQAEAITQGADAVIQAGSLTTSTANGTSLPGANQVSSFNATNMTSGDILFNNTSPLLTVTGINQVPSGAFTLTQDGDLAVTGNVFSGPQLISATGDMVVGADTNSVILYAAGPQAINASGEPNASPHAFGVGLLDRIAGHGPVNITARSLSVQGGSSFGSFAAITGGPINVTTTGDVNTGDVNVNTGHFSIGGGSGLGSFGWVLSSQDINLRIGGNLMLNSGTGFLSFARMQTVHPTSVINVRFPNLSSRYFVNGNEGAYRDGLSGFFTGPVAARPGTRLITTYGE